ncbi:MAG: hypothetical protein NZ609_10330, partial [Acidimicrobiales bacterium]|nr:hypothetical protein [Acidimicrobiales bacterium]
TVCSFNCLSKSIPRSAAQFALPSANSVRAQIKEDRAIWAESAHHLDLTTIDPDRHAVARDVPGDLRAHGIGLRAVTDSEISTSLESIEAKP